MILFVRILSILTLSISLVSCGGGEEGLSSQVSLEVPTPLVLLVDRELLIGQGLEIITVTLEAPWAVINFQTVNNSSTIVTVIGGSYVVTDPLTGDRKVVTLESVDSADLTYEGVIFPRLDVDCDGFVSDTELANGVEPTVPCTAIVLPDGSTENVNVLDSRTFYLTDMASAGNGASGTGVDDSVAFLYRGLSFSVEARIEGWFGPPSQPIANFFNTTFFQARSN